jgi:[acyl-carrier-protein] S-malonyltransferase
VVALLEKTAGIMPGQGTQRLGMGKEYYEGQNLERLLAEAQTEDEHSLLLEVINVSLHGPGHKLNRTEWVQPAVLLYSVAAAKTSGILPAYLTGHSMGFISAAVVAGALSLPEGVRLAKARGELMEQHTPRDAEYSMFVVFGLDDIIVNEVFEHVGFEL